MKKYLIIIAVILVIFFIIFNFTPVFAPHDENNVNTENIVKDENVITAKNETNETKEEEIKPTPYASYNGWLKVENTNLKNSKNENFTLKGISSHGLQWYSDVLTFDNLKRLKDTWKINVFRIAMYTDEGGYISKKEETKNNLKRIVNDLVSLDMYVIIDWHILKDNNPNIYKEDSKQFFAEISELYKNTPNVIYEICNEPNGNVNWSDVKSYAEEVIPVIRKNSPNSLIIVGTPFWCQQLQPAADNPLSFNNLLYSCHFYAGTHKQNLRDEVSKALEKNLPIIISEFGTTDASGNGNVDIEESKKWIDFLNEKNISYINWSFAYKNESSALLLESYGNNLTQDFNNYLSESGKFIKSIINVY